MKRRRKPIPTRKTITALEIHNFELQVALASAGQDAERFRRDAERLALANDYLRQQLARAILAERRQKAKVRTALTPGAN